MDSGHSAGASAQEKVIRQIYYNESGFGSIAETYKEAKKILNSITLNDVKEFLEKQKTRQIKGYKGFNSYVADHALQEIQIDIAVFTESAEDNKGFRYCFVAIDIFTKYCHAVPIKDKKPPESVRAMTEILDKIGVPENIYHDDEGSWNNKDFIKLLNQNNIKQIITSTPPPFAERMVQEIKNMIHIRLQGLEVEHEEWVKLLPAVLNKYNNRIHGTIKMSPIEARQNKNRLNVFFNISLKAQYNRTYPELSMGDFVRTYVKPGSFKKGYESRWSPQVYKIIHITPDKKQFIVDNGQRRLYSRHELLRIKGAEGKDG